MANHEISMYTQNNKHTHTHTHTHIYIYIYVYKMDKNKKQNQPYNSFRQIRVAKEKLYAAQIKTVTPQIRHFVHKKAQWLR
jgi:hypothetical protein